MKFQSLTYGLILMMTVVTTVVQANEEVVKKPTITSYQSFSLINNLIVVQAELSGVRGNYIFDTGASGLVLNTEHQSSSASENTITGASGALQSQQKHIRKFQFGNITKRNFKAACLSLSHIEASMDMRIDGLIGLDMLKEASIIIDHKAQLLLLVDPTNQYNDADIKLNIETISGIPTIKSKLNGQAMNLAIDFGATSTIIDQSIIRQMQLKVVEQIDLLTTGGKSKALNKVECNNLQLGDHFQFDTQAIVTDLSHLQADGVDIHGVVGLDLLKEGQVMINPSKGFLYIWTE